MSSLTPAQKRTLGFAGKPATVRWLGCFFHTPRQQQSANALVEKGLIQHVEGYVLTEKGEQMLDRLTKETTK